MKLKKRIEAFAELGLRLREAASDITHSPLLGDVEKASASNHWFIKEHVEHALSAWGEALTLNELTTFAEHLTKDEPHKSLNIAIVMAGNLPLVGMHDWLSVLLAGHKPLVKLSAHDNVLLPAVEQMLCSIAPEMEGLTTFCDKPLSNFDAVIATGSNNSGRYFDYYFSKYPHIIRRNRHSAAILSGQESDIELSALARDLFLYFGLGCRNVSKLFVPCNYDFQRLIEVTKEWQDINNTELYNSTYNYYKALMIMNGGDFIDAGFWTLQRSETLHSPISVVHYEPYNDVSQLIETLSRQIDELQCVVCGAKTAVREALTPLRTSLCIDFGEAQRPRLTDFADGIDTLQFLSNLS